MRAVGIVPVIFDRADVLFERTGCGRLAEDNDTVIGLTSDDGVGGTARRSRVPQHAIVGRNEGGGRSEANQGHQEEERGQSARARSSARPRSIGRPHETEASQMAAPRSSRGRSVNPELLPCWRGSYEGTGRMSAAQRAT